MKACDLLKKDGRCRGKSVKICWQMDASKDRGVEIDGQTIFKQISTDSSGLFLAPFQDLSF